MVLYPLSAPPDDTCVAAGNGSQPSPAWDAIERAQRRTANEWWLVAQPDHAALAGDLAERIESGLFPKLDSDVVQAIARHDEGWAEFDYTAPKFVNGRPASFLEMPPVDFLRAWRGSIQRAEQVAPIAGILVSEHFCRLGRTGLARAGASGSEGLIEDFLASERIRQECLTAVQSRPPAEIQLLIDVLQFCDLLSLYLCCGSREWIEFPQEFQKHRVRIRYQCELAQTDPPIFNGGTSLAVTARKYPPARAAAENIPILIA